MQRTDLTYFLPPDGQGAVFQETGAYRLCIVLPRNEKEECHLWIVQVRVCLMDFGSCFCQIYSTGLNTFHRLAFRNKFAVLKGT